MRRPRGPKTARPGDDPPAAPHTARIHATSTRGSVSWFNGSSGGIQPPRPAPVKLGQSRHWFIPARAGNTWRCALRPSSSRVHPRAGGEHSAVTASARSRAGSSPRGRGTLLQRGFRERKRAGSSPRGRGTQVPGLPGGDGGSVHPRAGGEHTPGNRSPETLKLRFIPARAGNTRRRRCPSRAPTVHPRAGGEHSSSADAWTPHTGSSPRGRGTHHDRNNVWATYGSSPRGRGTRCTYLLAQSPPVHPRAGGEHRDMPQSVPRILERFIPARAGNTCRTSGALWRHSVHPRAGGEHTSSRRIPATVNGSSPRGRGTLSPEGQDLVDARFIPARAGNTLLATV